MTEFFFQPKLEVMFSRDQLAKRVQELGAQITKEYMSKVTPESPLVVVGILKGSFVFLADLVRAIDLPLVVELMGVSSYGDATESSGVVQLTQDLTRPVADQHVLLVEDIVDTGLTMRYLLSNMETRQPASLKLASLLEKPSKNQSGVKVDYLGFSIEDKFVVGYGLDAASLYRNLPFVGLVKG
jgi:hypoxanthine phosphoribosyltransferase